MFLIIIKINQNYNKIFLKILNLIIISNSKIKAKFNNSLNKIFNQILSNNKINAK